MRGIRTLFLFLALFTAANAVCGQKADLLRENRRMEAELKLAKHPKIYVVFDLRGKKVSLRARGMEMTGFPIGTVSVWGNQLDDQPLSLVAKGTFIRPGRKKIKPGQAKEQAPEDTFELDALEMNDMPSRYTVYLERGVCVCVRPATKGFLLTLINAGDSFTRALARSFYSAWAFFRKKPFTEADITLNDKDARALYWAMSEGTPCILAPP